MPQRSEGASVDRLRGALAAAVAAEGLRPVARAAGLDPTNLRKLLDGSTPRAGTLRKVQAWYSDRVADGVASLDADTARAFLGALTADLPPGRRGDAVSGVVVALSAAYEDAQVPMPGWLSDLDGRARRV